ncbi:probable xyloglucan endotransglucosylase/hydrolase protein 30 [Macadamia integrifolia]|uniref:probable xyloglucan endotransglucosylase/hydrolase protein 30 n=1 Tax=Macadamia integrifolia TaxID=60698 RepID=UPI001C4FC9B4|nr:probable xyloglucan endotransglucosylase/hydrolase protein 30 [Macadamia integrifolia]
MGPSRRLRCSLSFLLSLAFASVATAALNVTTIPFHEGYSPLFGDFNIHHSPNGKSVNLHLDRYTGSGFISSNLYNYGFFSANIKLPSDYTAGVVVAFYTSNADVFSKTHDELDIEFLGNIRGKDWRFQTNVYGNGSTYRGREERYFLWFDPTQDYHRYSILWTEKNIIFYVDEVPIREVVRSDAMGGDYPSKPMALYATIWDASTWATSGGKYKVNYKYAPFVAEFKDFALQGCPVDPIQQVPNAGCSEKISELEATDYAVITPARRAEMKLFQQKYMYYSYCYDTLRYPVPLPECVADPVLKRRFKNTGRVKFGGHHHRHSKKSRNPSLAGSENQADM